MPATNVSCSVNMSITKAVGFATPLSNTGSLCKKVESRVDWLQGVCTMPQTGLHPFIDGLGAVFRDSFGCDRGLKFCGRTFQHHVVSDRGCRVYYNFLENDLVEILIALPAKFLAGVHSIDMFRLFLKDLASYQFRATRIDLAIDDYTKSLSVQQFREAKDLGLQHGYKSHRTIYEDSIDKGFTHYMGSPSGDKYYRFYDKSVESGGEIDAFRLEGEFKDGYAKSVFQQLLKAPNDSSFHQEIIDATLTPLDFYSMDENREKIFLEWWLAFKKLCNAGKSAVNSGRIKTSIDKTMEWIENQVEAPLANLERYLDRVGDDFCSWLNARLESGRRKLTPEHHNRIRSALAVLGVPSHISGEELREGWF